MITAMTISGFRTFAELRIDQLTRVNLFVGTNNAGKTSILEAVELVALGTPGGLRESLLRRAEEILVGREERGGAQGPELDPSHLFHGHALTAGKSLSIIADGEIQQWVRCKVFERELDNEDMALTISREDLGKPPASPLALHFASHLMSERIVPLTPYGSLTAARPVSLLALPEPSPVNFLGTEAITATHLGELWDAVVLTPEEDGVVNALRIIEPRIERIAFLVGDSRRSSRGIFLKLSDSEQRLPLGSVGDGLKRLLALTLHLFSARDGFLLVDEIDTGLHYSVMADMWRLVIETARRLDVQVMATTHSLDCVRALAWVREQSPDTAGEVTLHRIEKDARKTVAYDLDELAIAARDHIEVR